ncbi:hypothetical protein KY290_028367 [Solanum tuberosum]|uniref:Reverse transcriptase zinc-binding domain-containing protein n=1 Tax=Solanum tuberosum TaxID=4113 RepID=A0ABQ7UHP1_SOLTU|nr:hypothetical protein KY290_028367 [Solanum tuberosum]
MKIYPRVSWKSIMYKNAARPKAIFTTWLLMWGKLLTIDRLLKWGMQNDSKCPLCCKHEETKEHLFVHCDYAKQIWIKMENWTTVQHCTISTWDRHLDWMVANSKEHSQGAQVFKMVYSETIYAIWMERNFRIFEKRGRNGNQLQRR